MFSTLLALEKGGFQILLSSAFTFLLGRFNYNIIITWFCWHAGVVEPGQIITI
jgi:hypothetical protein